jgi:tetratricopeptide (TPR) repeat protein
VAVATIEQQAAAPTVETGVLCRLVAAYLLDRSRYDLAFEYCNRSLSILESAVGCVHSEYARALNSLGAICFETGAKQHARSHIDRALRIWEQTEPEGSVALAHGLVNLGYLCLEEKQILEAKHHFSRALHGLDITSETTELCARASEALALAYIEQKRYDKAQSGFNQALALRVRHNGMRGQGVGLAFANLAQLFLQQQRVSVFTSMESEILFHWALVILHDAVGATHPSAINTLGNYWLMLKCLHRETDATAVWLGARTQSELATPAFVSI